MALRSVGAVAVFACALAQPAHGSVHFSADIKAFLGRVPSAPAVVPEEEEALAQTARQLRPIFDTLPLNKYGRLDSAGVRYLMYRHFLHQHGWLMRGLVPDGDTWNATFPVMLVHSDAPRRATESLLADRGMSLHDAAELAGALQLQVEGDALARLHIVWRVHGLAFEDSAGLQDMDSILDMHMATYVLPDWWKKMELDQASAVKMGKWLVDQMRKEILYIYPTWPRTQTFLRKALQGTNKAVFDLDAAGEAVMRVLHRFGTWQDRECDELKQKLVQMESPRPGRVDLARFYGEAVRDEAQWMFSESVPYLRQLGAFDDSDAERPSVLIPNYINSAANHIGRSRYFELACISECEELLGHFERRLGAPAADPQRVAAVALRLPSPSHPQREVVPEELLKKLADIAVANGGQVPLHGRLFAQWLHHMYPRDCPYPHAAGSTKQEQADEFERRTGLASNETVESMTRIIDELSGAARVQTSTALPWDLDEELLDPPAPRARAHAVPLPLLAALLASLALGAASALAGRSLRRARVGGAVGRRGPLLDVDSGAGAPQPAAEAEAAAAS